MSPITRLIICFFAIFSTAHADGNAGLPDKVDSIDPVSAVRTKCREIKLLHGEFIQRTEHSFVGGADLFSGILSVKQPGRFRIDYTDPAGQFLVARHDTLWFYTPENKQMIRCMGAMDLDFLNLLERYLRKENASASKGDENWWIFTVVPGDESIYSRIDFHAREGEWLPRKIDLVDNSGITTFYEFISLESGVAVPDSLFRIRLPEGADLVDCSGDVLYEAERGREGE